ncbi:MAG TPA: hypothetical protein VFK14_02580, partial [Solirubrobacterales bacterium]|nr:hypothetical protein [Solirubrobacterales bacterium]
MAGVRVRWAGVGRAAAIGVVALVGLRLLPGLLAPPGAPPLAKDVGLPRLVGPPARETPREPKPDRIARFEGRPRDDKGTTRRRGGRRHPRVAPSQPEAPAPHLAKPTP